MLTLGLLPGCCSPGSALNSPMMNPLRHVLNNAHANVESGNLPEATKDIQSAQTALGPASTPAPKSGAEARKQLETQAAQERERGGGSATSPEAAKTKKWFDYFSVTTIGSLIALSVIGISASVLCGVFVNWRVGIAVALLFTAIIVGSVIAAFWKYLLIAVIVVGVIYAVIATVAAARAKRTATQTQGGFDDVVAAVQEGRSALASAGKDVLAEFDSALGKVMGRTTEVKVIESKTRNNVRPVDVPSVPDAGTVPTDADGNPRVAGGA